MLLGVGVELFAFPGKESVRTLSLWKILDFDRSSFFLILFTFFTQMGKEYMQLMVPPVLVGMLGDVMLSLRRAKGNNLAKVNSIFFLQAVR